ncbi:MAG: AAA family ATPase [Bacilli bacterium]
MNYKNMFLFLNENKLIDPVYFHLLSFISSFIDDEDNKDDILILFLIYFVLISKGNICMSLNENILKNKWNNFIDSSLILLTEDPEFNKEEFLNIKNITNEVISHSLHLINENNLPKLIGEDKLFVIDDDYLFIYRYNKARKEIQSSINRLFINNKNNNTSIIDYKTYIKKEISFSLSIGQESAVNKGVNNNLIITGGPGTGKTTSILFLLINLLLEDINYDIYLCAPSGKASSRMKESIIKGLSLIDEGFKNDHKEIFDIILSLEESTIHRLLGVSQTGFLHNSFNRFNSKSIFIIDESSMIDICLFSSLLSSIETGSKIYIMGDKNQLPSVEVGAVFFELLKMKELENNIVYLDESKRFSIDTEIYAFADKINRGLDLSLTDSNFLNLDSFKIEEVKKEKPIYFYDINFNSYQQFVSTIKTWGMHFYSSLQTMSMNLDPLDYQKLKSLFSFSEQAKILCAENEGKKGVKKINKIIKNCVIDTSLGSDGSLYYPGQVMMINKNNKGLDLYNGDSGLLVTFKDDNTLYFMVNKSSEIINQEGKRKDEIFKIKDFIFYPIRMIAKDEIDNAFAITIHKSQGSDYNQILVILPNKIGHPLLNRQIVYTAITRTKGNTYILSNKECLNYAKDNIEIRDTLIA